MSRYRPPRPPSAKYITAEGEKMLQAELHQLWKVERPVVTQSVSEAAALGDRSENAEYIYGKKRLREIDSRVRYLSKRLEEMMVVSKPPTNQDKIYFGAIVTLKGEDKKTVKYKIVGPDELDPQKGHISIDGPMGRALLAKEVDSEIEVESPTGHKVYHVLSISYQAT